MAKKMPERIYVTKAMLQAAVDAVTKGEQPATWTDYYTLVYRAMRRVEMKRNRRRGRVTGR